MLPESLSTQKLFRGIPSDEDVKIPSIFTRMPSRASHKEMNVVNVESIHAKRDVSVIMQKVHSFNTKPELMFRKALWARGLRYRVCLSSLPGKPDVVVPAKRLAIFIDGDFWHGGQWRRRNLKALEDQFQESRSKEYWLKKIRRNMERDCNVTASLLSEGWTVLRFWESEIRKNLEMCVEMVLDIVARGAMSNSFSLLPRRTFAEFFAGIGLMRMGLERRNWSL